MKKTFSIMFSCFLVISLLVACTPSSKSTDTAKKAATAEIVNGKFVETRSITVEIYDRSNDGGTKPEGFTPVDKNDA